MSRESQERLPGSETGPQTGQSQRNGTLAPQAEKKLSGAELKKLKQQEKAAKRAAQKDGHGSQAPVQSPKSQQKQPVTTEKPQKHAAEKQLPTSKPLHPSPKTRRLSETKKETKTSTTMKQVPLFYHLYGQTRRHTIVSANKDVHPAILALGLQISSYEVCGSNARCVGMLLAFKSVIESYTTPPGTSIARHLIPHHLSPQITYLQSCRPRSISMGNAIRWLKDLIVKIDPAVAEPTAKSSLFAAIDAFIRERITFADTLIAESTAQKIVTGDVVLTYANSSIVRKTLMEARNNGTEFRVIVVDGKPLFEGRRLASELVNNGFDVEYSLVSGAAHVMKAATKVLLGAHAMMGNGRLYSRVGTAIVAMLAHERDVPVIVCCESVKFTEKVALDSIVQNEVAPAEELLERGEQGDAQVKSWRKTEKLQMLNVMYDVTPAEFIKMVVTEFGSLPPSSVPAVLRNLEQYKDNRSSGKEQRGIEINFSSTQSQEHHFLPHHRPGASLRQ